MVQLAQQFINALVLASMYSLFSVGYTLVFGVLDVLNLAHASVFMIGAVLSWYALDRIDWSNLPNALVFLLVLIGVFILTGLLGILIEIIAFAPLRARKAGPLPPLISSIGVSLILASIVQSIFGSDPRSFNDAQFARELVSKTHIFPMIPGVPANQILIVSWGQVVVFIISLLLTLGLELLVNRTRLGLSIRAVAENQRAARIVGINVRSVFWQTFMIAAGLGGVAGVLFAMSSEAYSASVGLGAQVELLGLTAIIIGGLGSIPGALLGSALIAFIQVFSVQFGFSNLRDAIVFGLLILMLVIRPGGLLGQQSMRRV